ncbi:MAG: hypothetical protein ACXAAI_04260 [Promethearchaeota archaeon]|jgi:hypothetical protein
MISIQKKKFYLATLLSSVILGIILITLLYSFSWAIIIDSYTEYNGALGVVLVITSRIGIVTGMTVYTFIQWFKQEEQYFSDLPFLFGLFFLLLVFGKALDMYNAFIFFQVGEIMVLIITKLRFIIMILDFLPMIYLSIGMILFSLSLKEKNRSLRDEKRLNAVRVRIIILIIISELTAILTINSISIISILYPIVVIPSLITIVWLFNFAYRNKRLSQVNASILWIGFTAYLVSQIVRPLVQFIIGESALFLIIAETLDLSIFVVIFIGFYKRANYSVVET